MHIAGHDLQQWFAAITVAGGAFFMVVRLIRSAWRFFWKVAKAIVSEVVDPAFEKVNANVDSLRHYTEYHLGPNDTTKPVHQRIERIERDNEVILMRQTSQHRENKKSIVDLTASVTSAEHVPSPPGPEGPSESP